MSVSGNKSQLVGDACGTFDRYTEIAAKDGRYRVQFYVLNLLGPFNTAHIAGEATAGVEATHGLPYTYKRRFGVSLQMDW